MSGHCKGYRKQKTKIANDIRCSATSISIVHGMVLDKVCLAPLLGLKYRGTEQGIEDKSVDVIKIYVENL